MVLLQVVPLMLYKNFGKLGPELMVSGELKSIVPHKRSDKRVGVVVFGVPHPTDGASSVLFYFYIKGIVDAGYDVLVQIVSERERSKPEKVDEFRKSIGLKGVKVIELLSQERVLVPNRFCILSDTSVIPQIKENLRVFGADQVVAFDLPAAFLLADYECRNKIVWLGDLRFQAEWYHFLYSVKEQLKNLRNAPYALVQKTKWQKIYKNALLQFHDVIVSSKSSEFALKNIGIDSSFEPYPWPNKGSVDSTANRKLPEKPTFIFFGHLFGLGSRSSLHFMFKKLYPELIKIWGRDGFVIILGGREVPPTWAMLEINEKEEFKFVGFINNLTGALSEVHGVIAPLDVPVGNRSRIITAQAKRALVISHLNAAMGNPYLVHNETCLLAKDERSFAREMAIAVENGQFSRAVIDKAELSYLDTYAPANAVERLVSRLK